MGLDESIGEVLRQVRRRVDLTQEELANRAGLHRTYVSMLERGLKSPTVDVLSRLGAAMGTTGSAILRRAETRTTKANGKPGSGGRAGKGRSV